MISLYSVAIGILLCASGILLYSIVKSILNTRKVIKNRRLAWGLEEKETLEERKTREKGGVVYVVNALSDFAVSYWVFSMRFDSFMFSNYRISSSCINVFPQSGVTPLLEKLVGVGAAIVKIKDVPKSEELWNALNISVKGESLKRHPFVSRDVMDGLAESAWKYAGKLGGKALEEEGNDT